MHLSRTLATRPGVATNTCLFPAGVAVGRALNLVRTRYFTRSAAWVIGLAPSYLQVLPSALTAFELSREFAALPSCRLITHARRPILAVFASQA